MAGRSAGEGREPRHGRPRRRRVAHRERGPPDPVEGESAPATAAAVGTRTASPMPFAPYGPSGCGSSTKIRSTGGIPAAGMIPSDFSVSVTGTPSRTTNASLRA